MSLPIETVHISLITFIKEHKSRHLLGPACTCSLPSGGSLPWHVVSLLPSYFVINSVSPCWNVGKGWNCSDISNLLLVCCPIPLWYKKEVAEILIFAWWYWLYCTLQQHFLEFLLDKVGFFLIQNWMVGWLSLHRVFEKRNLKSLNNKYLEYSDLA